MADKHGILEIETFHQLGEIIGVGVHVITLPGLAGPPMSPAIMSDTAIATAGQEEHLIFKGVGVEAIRVIKDNGLPFPPIFKIEFRAVFGLDGAHSPRVGLVLWFF